ncbi:DUF1330 domain-containing protein [Parasphingopyxis marina]|uniref:DUF1330 domain-containing protein n=1 Tax=Parasphingopyxis marina TaxID=2761622 RepID=A0A842HVN2_9SPHN|nr:DUF1330 domain-containing protein [Parasphingopyxis marina]MBC2778098.1 DUF1330 domain-containing protein [Parasphingopyxis marina]
MAAYFVANYRITNTEDYKKYGAVVGPTLAPHGAEVLAADPASEPMEGEPCDVTVVIKFPSKEAAKGWYNSPEYQAILPLRTDNSEGAAVLAAGREPPQ